MNKYRKALLYLNRAVYLVGVAMMIAGATLSIKPKPVNACHNVSVCDVPSYTTIIVLSDNLAAWFAAHPEDFEITRQHLCVPPTNTPTHTATFTNTPPPTPTHTLTFTPTYTASPTETYTPSATATDTATATYTPTETETATSTPTYTATATDTATATHTATETETATPTNTDTPTNTPNTKYVVLLDPFCFSVPGDQMQWTVNNFNEDPFTVLDWSIDGVLQGSGFIAPVGESLLTKTSLGTHTIVLYWEQGGTTSLEWTINSCQLPETDTPSPTNTRVPPTSTPVQDTATPVPTLPIPETGGDGGPIIPVTGSDLTQPVNGWLFGGFGMIGFGMVLTGLRKLFDL